MDVPLRRCARAYRSAPWHSPWHSCAMLRASCLASPRSASSRTSHMAAPGVRFRKSASTPSGPPYGRRRSDPRDLTLSDSSTPVDSRLTDGLLLATGAGRFAHLYPHRSNTSTRATQSTSDTHAPEDSVVDGTRAWSVVPRRASGQVGSGCQWEFTTDPLPLSVHRTRIKSNRSEH